MIQCPSCGGALRFEIESQQMLCDYCGSRFAPENIDTTSGDSAYVGMNAYQVAVHICPSCGAELMTNDANDAVGFCPFCGGASMIFSRIREQWKPDVVLPFRITKEECKAAYLKEARKSPFVAGRYRDPKLIESFRGFYMPYWIIDAECDGEYEVKITTREKGRWSNYSIYENTMQGYAKGKSRFVHDASLGFSDDISESLAPYPVTECKYFSAGYLSGFYTEIADLSEEEYNEQINELLADKQAENLSVNPVISGFFPQNTTVTKTESIKALAPVKKETKRALFPVWFMSNRKGKKIAYAAVNGATGKVAVDLPLSPVKILLTALLFSAVLFGASFLLPTIKAIHCMAICAGMMAFGLLTIESAFDRILKTRLGMDIKKSSNIILAAFFIPGIIIMVYLLTDDMTYLAALIILMFNIFVIACVLEKPRINKELKKTANFRFKGDFLQTVKTYRRVRWLFLILGILLAAASIVMLAMRLPAAIYMYGLCVLMTANLFGAAVAHIRFQVALSMRRPPQMNKKGALYDEN